MEYVSSNEYKAIELTKLYVKSSHDFCSQMEILNVYLWFLEKLSEHKDISYKFTTNETHELNVSELYKSAKKHIENSKKYQC